MAVGSSFDQLYLVSLPEYKKAMHTAWFRAAESTRHPLPYSVVSSPRPQEVLEYLKKKQHREIISLKKFIKIIAEQHMQYCGHNQHDAQEFFSTLIRSIHNEMKPVMQREVEYLYSLGLRWVIVGLLDSGPSLVDYLWTGFSVLFVPPLPSPLQ